MCFLLSLLPHCGQRTDGALRVASVAGVEQSGDWRHDGIDYRKHQARDLCLHQASPLLLRGIDLPGLEAIRAQIYGHRSDRREVSVSYPCSALGCAMMATEQREVVVQATKATDAILSSMRDVRGVGGNNCDVDVGEARTVREETLQRSPLHSRRERGQAGDPPLLGHYRMGSASSIGEKEEEEEGESETDSAALEGSPLLHRRRSSPPKGTAAPPTVHNNDEDLRSSGEILPRSTEVMDGAIEREALHEFSLPTAHEVHLPVAHVMIVCDGVATTNQGDDCGFYPDRTGGDAVGRVNQDEESANADSDADIDEAMYGYDDDGDEGDGDDDDDGDLGFPENFSTSRRGDDEYDESEYEEEDDESDFVPCSDDEYDDSLEFRSWTFDEDHEVEEELQEPPFWFGHEDSEHIEAIVKCYEDELVEQPEPCCRSLKPFVGSIARVIVSTSDTNLETFDTVVICNNQRMEPGKSMPVECTLHVLTSWETNDGVPESFQEVPPACLEHWAHICSGKESFFLFCEPRFFDVGTFCYSSSTTEREVGYAALPWQSTPFDGVAPLWEQEPSMEDVFPGVQSDIDGPFAATNDPNWSWIRLGTPSPFC